MAACCQCLLQFRRPERAPWGYSSGQRKSRLVTSTTRCARAQSLLAVPSTLAAVGSRGVELLSALGKGGKIALGLPIPPHSFDGILPPALHLLQGTFVTRVAVGHQLLEMSILRLDHLVCGHAMVRKIA